MYIPSGITPMTFYEQHKNEFTHARITFTNSNIVFEDDDFESEGIEIRQYMNSATDLTFGTASCVEVEIHMFRSSVTDTLKWSEEFLLEFGFDVTNGTIWLPIGYFTGSKPTRTQVDVIQFMAYDRMTKFDILADDFIDSLDFTSSKTLTQIYSALCTYVGVTSESGNEIAANMAHSYSKCPVGKGCSCRDILAKIAEAAGCYAIITREGKVKMVWYTDHTEDFVLKRDDIYAVDVAEIDWLYNASLRKKWIDLETERWKDLESLTWKELEGYYSPTKVNAVKFVYSDEDIGITVPNDLATTNIYTIVNNPFLYGSTTQETTGYLTNLYNRLQAFGIYVPVSVECIGNMFVEPGDIIKLEFEDNSVGRYPVFNRTIHYNGALTCVYETTGNLDREPVSEANKQKMEAGGKIHILRKTVDELYSEIYDPQTGLATKFSQTDGQILQTAVATKAAVYYSNTQPTGTQQIPLAKNDLWIDTAHNNKLYSYTGSAWVDASYENPDMTKVFYSSTTPTTGVRTGDLWINTANNNEMKRYNGSTWDDASYDDPDKTKVFYSGTAPSTGIRTGDLWINTSNNNEMKRYNGSSWDDASYDDPDKAKVFYSASAPATGMRANDLWIDTDDNNKMYRYNGSTWDDASYENPDNAKVFYSSTAPSTGMKANDLWIDTGDNNKLYRYSGSAWEDASYDDTSKARIFVQNSAPTGSQADPLRDGDLWADTANDYKLYSYDLTNTQWVEASPDKYTIQSGVAITANGVEITGGKYVKIMSGGVFEVDSTNFKVQSQNNLMQTGDWRMTDDGFAGVWKDKFNSDRCISIRKEVNAQTMPSDLDACTCGVFMYSINSGSTSNPQLAENEQFWITLAYPNTLGISQTIVRYRNGYFRFMIKKAPAYFWYDNGGVTYQQYLISTVFHCQSIGYAASGFIIETGFFKNMYVDTIEPYTTDDVSTNYQSVSTARGHLGTNTHKWAYIYGYYIYYNTLTQQSSRDVKHDIKALPSVGEKIDKLQPVNFVYNDDENEKQRTGLIYEDVVEVMPEICSDDEGQKSINYIELIPMLLKEVQELRKRVAELEAKVK